MNGKTAKRIRQTVRKNGHDPKEAVLVVGKRTDKEFKFLDGRNFSLPRLTAVLAEGCGRSLYLRLKREFKK